MSKPTPVYQSDPKLCAEIAEKIFDWKRGTGNYTDHAWLEKNGAGYHCLLSGKDTHNFRPDVYIADAMLVIEKMRDHHWPTVLIGIEDGFAHVEFCQPGYQIDAFEKTLPLAICRAALRAVQANEGIKNQ